MKNLHGTLFTYPGWHEVTHCRFRSHSRFRVLNNLFCVHQTMLRILLENFHFFLRFRSLFLNICFCSTFCFITDYKKDRETEFCYDCCVFSKVIDIFLQINFRLFTCVSDREKFWITSDLRVCLCACLCATSKLIWRSSFCLVIIFLLQAKPYAFMLSCFVRWNIRLNYAILTIFWFKFRPLLFHVWKAMKIVSLFRWRHAPRHFYGFSMAICVANKVTKLQIALRG